MQISILSAEINTIPTKKGSYRMADVAYRNLGDGKVSNKKVPDFTVDSGFDLLQTGNVVEIYMEKEAGKDGKEYWQWKKVNKSDGTTAPTKSAAVSSPKSTYETPEERALRQRLIVRQSSITNAISTLKTDKAAAPVQDVLTLAEQYYNFVYESPAPEVKSVADMEDDIPY